MVVFNVSPSRNVFFPHSGNGKLKPNPAIFLSYSAAQEFYFHTNNIEVHMHSTLSYLLEMSM